MYILAGGRVEAARPAAVRSVKVESESESSESSVSVSGKGLTCVEIRRDFCYFCYFLAVFFIIKNYITQN